MRAILSKETGGPDTLVLEEVEDLTPQDDEVIIDVKACGVNYPDYLIIEDRYQFQPPRPFSPGAEIAGVIAAVGDDVARLSVGDRVIAASTHGGMATQFRATAAQCLPMPKDMPFEDGATLLLTYATAYYALADRGDLSVGETLLVLGASGGVGSAAIEIGKALGANVVAAASTQDKVDFAKEVGAKEGVVYPRGDLDKATSKKVSKSFKDACGGAADVIFDPVGGALAEPALRAIAWEGRFLVIGFTAGIPSIPLNLTLLKGCQIVGVFWGSHTMREPERHQRNVAKLMKMYEEGAIRPNISERFPLERAPEAIQALAERRARGKLVVTME